MTQLRVTVELQVLRGRHGGAVYLFRSRLLHVQLRHQKVLEKAPAANGLDAEIQA
ncbi:hypothetical protein ACFFYR_34240 [Paraburkholderia dipogonis]|uniref:ATP-binding protein n=1 Tax=Paraburkholderia dipogonis TaxID=1211383 RepID=UPI0035E989D0